MDNAENNTIEHRDDLGEEQTSPRVIAISSGKGGVGKSSIAVNLGISLAKTGARVCIFDADTGLANVNILLGLTPQYSLEHVLFGAKAIEDVMLEGPHGVKIVPGANGISECVSLHPRQQMRLTSELARIENAFDYILVDTAAGISDTTLDFISASQHALVVITPEPTSLTDAFSLIKLLKRRRSQIAYHVVVNMCSNTGQAKEVFHRFSAAVEKYIGIEPVYLGYILRDESLRAAVTLQNPVALFPESDPSCSSFIRLADSLDRATAEPIESPAFSAYWQKQYLSQGCKQEKTETSKPEPESNGFSAEKRDNDYVSELRSRLLLMIEQGNAEVDQIADLLQENVDAFIKRNDASPINMLALLDQQLALPEIDEDLMREVYERVKPWGSGHDAPPTEEMVGTVDDVEQLEAAVLETTMPEPTLVETTEVPEITEQQQATPLDDNVMVETAVTHAIEPSVFLQDRFSDQVEIVVLETNGVEHQETLVSPSTSHQIDQRFGPQQELVEKLRNLNQPVNEWLMSIS